MFGEYQVVIVARTETNLSDGLIGWIIVPIESSLLRLEPQHDVNAPFLTLKELSIVLGDENLGPVLLQ